MQFHERLKEYRKNQGLTQEELAEKLHVSRSAVAKWENGLGLPSDDSLDDIAALFGVGCKDPRLGKGDVKIYYDTRLFTFDEGEFSEGDRESTPVDLYPFYFSCLDTPAYTEIFVTAVGFCCKVAVIIEN